MAGQKLYDDKSKTRIHTGAIAECSLLTLLCCSRHSRIRCGCHSGTTSTLKHQRWIPTSASTGAFWSSALTAEIHFKTSLCGAALRVVVTTVRLRPTEAVRSPVVRRGAGTRKALLRR